MLCDAGRVTRYSPTRLLLLVVGCVVLGTGDRAAPDRRPYLGNNLGAGPAEAAALAWDPRVPFKWSYSAVQGGGAIVGWLLGAAVDLTARTLRVNVSRGRAAD